MGHAEMILAVAGMSDADVAEQTRRLAKGAKGSGTSAELAAFAFARKQATEPWAIGAADMEKLEKEFGTAKAWQVVWWASRCHYMTKVADAFQLPLEKENPFLAMPGAKPAK